MASESAISIVEAELSGLAYGGQAIGSINVGPIELLGKKILVVGGIPGELVEAKITRQEKNIAFADLVSVIRPSSARIIPDCSVYAFCGGCDYQHIQIEKQRDLKVEMVRSHLEKHSGLAIPDGVQLSKYDMPAWRYRQRIALHIGLQGQIGFYRSESNDIVEFNDCLISSEKIMLHLQLARPILVKCADCLGKAAFENSPDGVSLILECRAGMHISDEQLRLLQTLKDLGFYSVKLRRRHDMLELYSREKGSLNTAGHFSQVNDCGNAILTKEILELFEAGPITEFYAGSGNFSLPLAQRNFAVTAIELDRALVQSGKAKAAILGLDKKINFVCSSTENYVHGNQLCSSLLIGPPRSGAKVLVSSAKIKEVQRLVYVSCNLPSFGRDSKILANQGLALQKVILVDMFAQTQHIELVGLFLK